MVRLVLHIVAEVNYCFRPFDTDLLKLEPLLDMFAMSGDASYIPASLQNELVIQLMLQL